MAIKLVDIVNPSKDDLRAMELGLIWAHDNPRWTSQGYARCQGGMYTTLEQWEKELIEKEVIMAEQKYMYQLVADWQREVNAVASAKLQLEQAQTRLKEAGNVLGRKLDPGDMVHMEKMCCWVKTGFRQEQVLEVTKYTVKTPQPVFQVKLRGTVRSVKD